MSTLPISTKLLMQIYRMEWIVQTLQTHWYLPVAIYFLSPRTIS